MSRFVSITEARQAPGLRMACLRGIPSPWTEAAKGLFHVKGIDCQYAAQSEDDPENAIAAWAGNSSVPVVAFDDEPLRTGWVEILLLAERLAPDTPLLPSDWEERALVFGICQELAGEMGLGWAARNMLVRQGFESDGAEGFHPKIGKFLSRKYGYRDGEDYRARVMDILQGLSARIEGRDYLVGDRLTAADIYLAVFINLVAPLPEDKLPMNPRMRPTWESAADDVKAAASSALLAHRDRIYEEFLELPVPL
ncbi:glutathione S-transferase family protein [Minwuia sp.]|uniref:glutathione S-transferase family protein n=1 Tax=Minwuia sp. TaxID=2493630 RepID=UPI003A8DCBA2